MLRGFIAQLQSQFVNKLLNVDLSQEVLDRLCAHFCDELVWIIACQFAETLVVEQIFLFKVRHIALIDHDICLKIEDLFEIAKRDVEQMPDTRRQALKEPHVRARRCQLDMP